MKLTILDPGHFHAALVQKHMYPDVDAAVHVYAPEGPDLDDYLRKIEGYNARPDTPTRWRTRTCTGADFLDRFVADKAGDVVVISGNNQRKTEYLTRGVAAGIHVLADKPMAIDAQGFAALEKAFATAREKGVLLYDIMTERHEITTLLQKEFSTIPSVFGVLQTGTADNPAVTKESVHHFSKLVSGAPVKRPAWFFDVAQQGEGIVDITTHLVDLVQWECFPGQILDYRKDIRILGARRWPTVVSAAQFASVTHLETYPAFLRKDVQADGALHTFANGEIDYCIKGVHARVSVLWHFEAPEGAGDTHFSVMRGTQANLVIRQGEAERYQPVLSVEPHADVDRADFANRLRRALASVQEKYPGVDLKRAGDVWHVEIPASYHVGHEAHFGQVTEQFLACVKRGALPDWEVPNMLAKYHTTTRALEIAHGRPDSRQRNGRVRGFRGGFSMMELMVVVAIVAILAALAIPSFSGSVIRDQIVAAVPLADIAKKPVALMWATAQAFPADNAAAGLPAADKIVNNYISSVAVENGTIQITFGNNAHKTIVGKMLTFRPAVVDDAPVVPVAWVCGYAAVPGNMSAKGQNKTDIPTGYLPFNCREPAK